MVDNEENAEKALELESERGGDISFSGVTRNEIPM